MTSVVRRVGSFAALVLVILGAARPARAGVLPRGAEVPAGRLVDLAAFTRLVASRYDVVFRSVIAADVDRDGDQDVVSTGAPGFVVWLNDGAGHLTSQPDAGSRRIDDRAPARAWRERSTSLPDQFQNEGLSLGLPADPEWAALACAPRARVSIDVVVPAGRAFDASGPRAPPRPDTL